MDFSERIASSQESSYCWSSVLPKVFFTCHLLSEKNKNKTNRWTYPRTRGRGTFTLGAPIRKDSNLPDDFARFVARFQKDPRLSYPTNCQWRSATRARHRFTAHTGKRDGLRPPRLTTLRARAREPWRWSSCSCPEATCNCRGSKQVGRTSAPNNCIQDEGLACIRVRWNARESGSDRPARNLRQILM